MTHDTDTGTAADTAADTDTAVVHVHTTEDARFGGISVRLDTRGGSLEVEGASIPRVTLHRAPGTEVSVHVPVGTRDGSRLTLTVDGEIVPVTPRKGRFLRRSYAVDVTYGGSRYRLVPDSFDRSRLSRDGLRLGSLASDGDGAVSAEWREGAEVEAVDVALGHALAAAFGTGGSPWWMAVLDLVGDLIPG